MLNPVCDIVFIPEAGVLVGSNSDIEHHHIAVFTS